MKRRLILILILLVVVAAGLTALYKNRSRDDAPGRIVVSGNIELTEVNIAFKTAGRLIERTVDEGDSVKKDQIIARLDRDQLIAQREREAAGLQSSATQLAQAETSLEWQRATGSREMSSFSVAPAISVKPVLGGIEVSVRYITRANERYQLRSKMYQMMVELLGGKSQHAPKPEAPPAPAD